MIISKIIVSLIIYELMKFAFKVIIKTIYKMYKDHKTKIS